MQTFKVALRSVLIYGSLFFFKTEDNAILIFHFFWTMTLGPHCKIASKSDYLSNMPLSIKNSKRSKCTTPAGVQTLENYMFDIQIFFPRVRLSLITPAEYTEYHFKQFKKKLQRITLKLQRKGFDSPTAIYELFSESCFC